MSNPNIRFTYSTIPPLKKHTATVIFAHGLGESGHIWKQVVQQLQVANVTLQHTKWILLHAPKRLVTGNYKVSVMPSWFNTDELTTGYDPQWLENMEALSQLIEREMAYSSLNSDRIFLGGYGQGGMMTLGAGLTLNKRLGGVIVLSAMLPLKYQLKENFSQHAKETPIFWSVGSADPAISVNLVQESIDFLEHLGFQVATGVVGDQPKGILFNVYYGSGHASEEQERDSLAQWLSNVCPVIPQQRL